MQYPKLFCLSDSSNFLSLEKLCKTDVYQVKIILNCRNITSICVNYSIHQSHVLFFSEKPSKADVYQVKIILNFPTSHHSALHCNFEAPCSSSLTQEFQTNELGWSSIPLVSLDSGYRTLVGN